MLVEDANEILRKLIKLKGRVFVNDLVNKIDDELWEASQTDQEEKARKNRESYQKNKERKEIRGESFSKTIKAGDTVKVEGTKDRYGYREVLSVDSRGITARQLQPARNHFGDMKIKWKRAPYLTLHMWNKIVKQVDIEIVE